MQILEEEDEFSFAFDVLDATKIWPEELVPVRRIGKMTLNRNPENFFAETEQVAFHTGTGAGHRLHQRSAPAGPAVLVPGYAAAATGRAELRRDPDQQVHRDRCATTSATAFTAAQIDHGRTAYFPNTLGLGCPALAPPGRRRLRAPPRAGRRRQDPRRAASASRTTSARRGSSTTACPNRSSDT